MLPQKPALPSSSSHALVERLVLVGVRHRQVAGQDVEQRRDVGRPLDAGVPAQGHDAATGTADVAQQQLQDRGGADDLGAHAVVGPADRVAERGGALAAAVARSARRRPRANCSGRDAADLLHHLGGVAGEVPLEDLVDAARVLQRLVAPALPADRRRHRSRAPPTGPPRATAWRRSPPRRPRPRAPRRVALVLVGVAAARRTAR